MNSLNAACWRGGSLRPLDWLVAALVFVAGFAAFTRHNDFPAHYHPDEPGKVRQLRDGTFNFNHPLLLLQASRVLARDGTSLPELVVAGRTASAVFAAAAAACLALAAASLAGTTAGIAAGALVLANRQFYELAHYMKEDPAMAFGVSLAVLAFLVAWRRPGVPAMAALGAACGVALSAKYLGALTLVLVLAAGFRTPRPWAGLAAALGATVLVAAAINWPVFASLGTFSAGLSREMDFAVHGHKGLTRRVPHGVYGAVFREATNPAIWILLGLWAWRMVRGLATNNPTRKAIAPELVLAGFAALIIAILSFSPKTHHRYFLPITGMLLAFAATGAARCLGDGGWRRVLGGALLAVALVWSAASTVALDNAFARDTRREFARFVSGNLPADATIAQDKRVGLAVAGDPRFEGSGLDVPQRILGKLFAADLGTLAELRSQGISYVAVSKADYGRFFLETHTPRDDDREDYLRRKAFYEELFASGHILWERPAGPLPYLQPHIRLYQLPPPSP